MRNAGQQLDEINYARTALDEATVLDLAARAGSVAALINTRHAIAKERGWIDKPPSAKEFARAVVADVNLMRRPILVIGKRVIVGFDKAAYAKL